jgi:hypothetical protein
MKTRIKYSISAIIKNVLRHFDFDGDTGDPDVHFVLQEHHDNLRHWCPFCTARTPLQLETLVSILYCKNTMTTSDIGVHFVLQEHHDNFRM